VVRPEAWDEMDEFGLSSPAFGDGGRIPARYGHDEANVNPPLRIEGVPSSATVLALVMDDPDALEPTGTVWTHWTVWNVDPGTTEIPEDWDAADATEGENDFGERGYGGPNPPDRTHTYRLRLYALDARLDLPPGASAADLEAAMADHVLAEARLTGTYSP